MYIKRAKVSIAEKVLMKQEHHFKETKGWIEKDEGKYTATCRCGWASEKKDTKEEAVINLENHVESTPHHLSAGKEEGKGKNFLSIFLAVIGLLYVIWPFDFIPDELILVGWIGDILAIVFSIIFLKKGLDGKGPIDALNEIFG